MKILTFPIKYNRVELVFTNLCCLLLIIMSVMIFKSFSEANNGSQHIPSDQLYIYSKVDGLDLSQFEPIFPLQASLDKLPNVEVETGLELYNLDIPSFASYNLKSNYYDYSQGDFKTTLYPDYTSTIVRQTVMANQTYQLEQILTGSYPLEESDLLIGEYLAIGYMTELKLDSYQQLIGQEVTLKINNNNYQFTISGVYSGGEALITNAQNKQFKSQARNFNPSYYQQFSTKHAKEQYLKASGLRPEQYLDSSSNPVNIQLIIAGMLLLVLNLLFITLTILTLRTDYLVIKYYKQKRALLITVIPAINLLGLDILFINWIR